MKKIMLLWILMLLCFSIIAEAEVYDTLEFGGKAEVVLPSNILGILTFGGTCSVDEWTNWSNWWTCVG